MASPAVPPDMPGRDQTADRLAQFQLALAENCTMDEAAIRLADRRDRAQRADAKARHGEAMRRLYAKGYGRR